LNGNSGRDPSILNNIFNSEKYQCYIDEILIFVSDATKFLKYQCKTYDEFYIYVCKAVGTEFFEDYCLTE
jgi:predicted nucleic acid-binding protein